MNPRIPLMLLAAMLAIACSRHEPAPGDDARDRSDMSTAPGAPDPAPTPPPQSPPTEDTGPGTEPHMVPNETTPAPESPPPETPPPTD